MVLLALFSVYGFARELQPIQLDLPVDDQAIHYKCEDAFRQAEADKQNDETRAGSSCLIAISPKAQQTLIQNFMVQCEKTVGAWVRGAKSNHVEVPVDSLKSSFDYPYGFVAETECSGDQQASRRSAAAARESGAESGAAAVREGCYAYSGCE